MGTLETGIPKIAQKKKKLKMASREEIASLKKHHKSFEYWSFLPLEIKVGIFENKKKNIFISETNFAAIL